MGPHRNPCSELAMFWRSATCSGHHVAQFTHLQWRSSNMTERVLASSGRQARGAIDTGGRWSDEAVQTMWMLAHSQVPETRSFMKVPVARRRGRLCCVIGASADRLMCRMDGETGSRLHHLSLLKKEKENGQRSNPSFLFPRGPSCPSQSGAVLDFRLHTKRAVSYLETFNQFDVLQFQSTCEKVCGSELCLMSHNNSTHLLQVELLHVFPKAIASPWSTFASTRAIK